ncbi:MAG: PAS domain-containing protein, partial [Coriobacteriales bacterium]|nr:PAS domain-containing protein [Coriobacteriales bacterium]
MTTVHDNSATFGDPKSSEGDGPRPPATRPLSGGASAGGVPESATPEGDTPQSDAALSREFVRLQRQYKKLERNYNALVLMQEQTERLRITNDQAKELADFYTRLLLRNTPSVALMIDLDMRFVLGSDIAANLLGYEDSRELVGLSFDKVLARSFPQQWIDAIVAKSREVIATAAEFSFEESVKLNDGRDVVFHTNITPAQEKDGICQGAVIVMMDVTALTHAIEAAKAASHAKTEFLSNMSHEMRTPMNAIIGMTSIGRASDDIEKKEYCLGKIEEASKHLLGVINDILDMSKIEARKFTLSEVDFTFDEMLRQVMTVNDQRVVEKSQSFDVAVDHAIPHYLKGDDQRLAQVITNLLSNAVKFTPEGGKIRLEARLLNKKSGYCTLEFKVIDNGIGISDEQQAGLFASFQQADTSITRRFGGTGLGLVISKEIVSMMGGSIWIESELGRGSTFFFAVRLGYEDRAPVSTDEDEGAREGENVRIREGAHEDLREGDATKPSVAAADAIGDDVDADAAGGVAGDDTDSVVVGEGIGGGSDEEGKGNKDERM